MAHNVVMPQFGVTTTEGTIVKWHKKVGDSVKIGETVFEVTTDKVNTEVEATVEGVLLKVLFEEGDKVRVTQTVAFIGDPNEDISKLEAGAGNAFIAGVEEKVQKTVESAPTHSANTADEKEKTVKISPVAKKIAAEKGIDLAKLNGIQGSGPGGIISKDDILNYLAKKSSEPSKQNDVAAKPSALSAMRKAIATNMLNSWQNIPQFNLRMDIDATSMIKKRNELNEKLKAQGYAVSISYTDFIVLAAAKAVADCPYMNSTFSMEGITAKDNINIGVAVALQEGLIVPNIKNVNQKTLVEIAKNRVEVIEKARAGKLTADDIKGGSVTISNLGSFEIDSFTAIINPPETAILAVGKLREKLVMSGNKIENQTYITIVTTIDHRVVDGAQGAQFMQKFKEYLENAENVFAL